MDAHEGRRRREAQTGKARFSIVWAGMWTDEKYLSLTGEARSLFAWAWQGQQASLSGYYQCSPKQMQSAIGEPLYFDKRSAGERVADALDELLDRRMVGYDSNQEIIWVKNRAKYKMDEGYRRGNEQDLRRWMKQELRGIPDSPLWKSFLSRYGPELYPELRGEGA